MSRVVTPEQLEIMTRIAQAALQSITARVTGMVDMKLQESLDRMLDDRTLERAVVDISVDDAARMRLVRADGQHETLRLPLSFDVVPVDDQPTGTSSTPALSPDDFHFYVKEDVMYLQVGEDKRAIGALPSYTLKADTIEEDGKPTVHRLKIQGPDGAEEIEVRDGRRGQRGKAGDGIKSVRNAGGNTLHFETTSGQLHAVTLEVHDGKDGKDGADGAQGPEGPAGPRGVGFTGMHVDGDKLEIFLSNGESAAVPFSFVADQLPAAQQVTGLDRDADDLVLRTTTGDYRLDDVFSEGSPSEPVSISQVTVEETGNEGVMKLLMRMSDGEMLVTPGFSVPRPETIEAVEHKGDDLILKTSRKRLKLEGALKPAEPLQPTYIIGSEWVDQEDGSKTLLFSTSEDGPIKVDGGISIPEPAKPISIKGFSKDGANLVIRLSDDSEHVIDDFLPGPVPGDPGEAGFGMFFRGNYKFGETYYGQEDANNPKPRQAHVTHHKERSWVCMGETQEEPTEDSINWCLL